ncbi:hypothetical protein AGLY_004095 [Aphis glycines]|uniref:Uncharacterized protein n=1 Tax=Aphis glycines TaxID=307491 RepID=A0A6G0TYF9_APHGL|nr:hypothetical protein AGLY_004095 [Aphis glycines]
MQTYVIRINCILKPSLNLDLLISENCTKIRWHIFPKPSFGFWKRARRADFTLHQNRLVVYFTTNRLLNFRYSYRYMYFITCSWQKAWQYRLDSERGDECIDFIMIIQLVEIMLQFQTSNLISDGKIKFVSRSSNAVIYTSNPAGPFKAPPNRQTEHRCLISYTSTIIIYSPSILYTHSEVKYFNAKFSISFPSNIYREKFCDCLNFKFLRNRVTIITIYPQTILSICYYSKNTSRRNLKNSPTFEIFIYKKIYKSSLNFYGIQNLRLKINCRRNLKPNHFFHDQFKIYILYTTITNYFMDSVIFTLLATVKNNDCIHYLFVNNTVLTHINKVKCSLRTETTRKISV